MRVKEGWGDGRAIDYVTGMPKAEVPPLTDEKISVDELGCW